MQKKDSNSSQQSIERALKLLNIMGETRTAMNITEISKVLGISRSTTYAMVNVMMDMNYLSKDQETGKYFLGYQIFMLGSIFRLRFSHLTPCDDYLKSFVRQMSVPYTRIGILVLEQDYRVLTFINKSAGMSSSPTIMSHHRILPAFCTAGGRVLLSGLSDDELKIALSKQDIRSYTSSTITDMKELHRQLQSARQHDYSIDIEEYINFEVNVAAPLRNHTGKTVAAINISISKMLYQNQAAEYIHLIQGLAREMSSILGYTEFPIV